MSTMPQPLQYQGSNDPRKIAQNQRAMMQQTGDQFINAFGTQGGQAAGQTQQKADYLNQIEDPLARGQGGYNQQELSQIRMTPQEQQNIVTGAGISAGVPTAAAVGAAERAAGAAGGSPAALAAYRARAAQQMGAQSGDAMTQARLGASNAAAQRAENVGQTRIGQQQGALSAQQQQLQMQNQNAQNAYQRQLQAYGTQAGATGQAANLGLEASQTPTTFDKVMGGIAGGVSSFLDEGDVMADDDTTPAVVGENGPEKVVNLRSKYLQDGTVGAGGGMGEDVVSDSSTQPQPPSPGNPGGTAPQPWYRKFGNAIQQARNQAQQAAPAAPTAGAPQQWNPVSTYTGIGQAAGNVGKALHFLGDGAVSTGMADRMDPIYEQIYEHRDVPRHVMGRIDRGYQSVTASPHDPKRVTRGPVTTDEAGTQPLLPRAPTPVPPGLQADGGITTNKTSRFDRVRPGPGGVGASGSPSPQGANGIFTKPTHVNLAKNEAVVPLSYRATAKTRPSMANLPAAPVTNAPHGKPYRASIRRPSIPPIGRR